MKQHITIEQYEGLTENQKEKLWDNYGFGFSGWKMSVGDMIEILGKNSFVFSMDKIYDNINETFEGWQVYVSYMFIDDMKEICTREMELCDALFLAVKEVLEG